VISQLDISNYALIERMELAFAPGLTVLTGETGAGKSILIGALSLALGDRADSAVVRQGAERAEVAATISIKDNEAAKRWLREQELDQELDNGGDECILRRTVSADGRSRAFINGSTVPLASLRALGVLLIDIHGQHEHHSLLEREHQSGLLDGYARHANLLAQVESRYREWRRLRTEAEELAQLSRAGGGELELLRYQAQELDALALGDDEVRRLDEEHRRLANAGQLIEACRAGIAELHEEEDAITDRVTRLAGMLRPFSTIDAGLASAVELLASADTQLIEAAAELRASLQRLDLDPQRLDQIDRRLGAIHELARKHRTPAAQLPALHEELRARLERVEGADARLTALAAAIAQAAQSWSEAAAELSTSRAKAARKLSQAVTREMRKLGMPDGSFAVELEPRTPDPSPAGSERALFLVATNPQQTPRPLAKIASGGELSRVGLAIQMITVEQTGVPSAVFDEVDVGVGGRVAEIVGQGLRALGTRRQVLCITHLPQVAALGHHHLRVAKSASKGKSAVTVAPLTRTERTEEIARMLGGVEISATTRAHAEEMIARSETSAEA
jgi:DNA repair protein RecN (Recombination protein N)